MSHGLPSTMLISWFIYSLKKLMSDFGLQNFGEGFPFLCDISGVFLSFLLRSLNRVSKCWICVGLREGKQLQ